MPQQTMGLAAPGMIQSRRLIDLRAAIQAKLTMQTDRTISAGSARRGPVGVSR